MIKFDQYYYRDEESPKLLVSLDWFKHEDHWYQRYMFDRPIYSEDIMEIMRLKNMERCEWFRISMNLFHYRINIDLKLKHVGISCNGKTMKDEPYVPKFVKRNREKKEKK